MWHLTPDIPYVASRLVPVYGEAGQVQALELRGLGVKPGWYG